MLTAVDWGLAITWGGTFLSGAFGIGVGYATLRERLKSFQREFILYKETMASTAASAALVAMRDYSYQKEHVDKMEVKIDASIPYKQCKDFRDNCSERISTQLNDLSKQMTNLQKFVGRVEQFMKENGTGKGH